MKMWIESPNGKFGEHELWLRRPIKDKNFLLERHASKGRLELVMSMAERVRSFVDHHWVPPSSYCEVLNELAPGVLGVIEDAMDVSLDPDDVREREMEEMFEQVKEEIGTKILKLKYRSNKRPIRGYEGLQIPHVKYMPVPEDRRPVPVIKSNSHLPDASGVYFIWEDASFIAYVGQSASLVNRVTSSHPSILHGDFVSYLEFSEEELNYAESYYIGICCPPRNFGGKIGKDQKRKERESEVWQLQGRDD